LIPWPGWHFAAAENDRGRIAYLRRAVWNECERRRLAGPISMKWHGARVNVYLDNDTGRVLFFSGCLEPNEFAFLAEVLRPGMNFVDLGANDGLYTVFASLRVGSRGRVISLEPSPREYRRLVANLERNRIANVQALQVAAGSEDGTAQLQIA